jgi:hypothetical protein
LENKSLSLFVVPTVMIYLIFSTFAAVVSQIDRQESVANASASNDITAALSVAPVLGNPIFSEHDKITSQKQVVSMNLRD